MIEETRREEGGNFSAMSETVDGVGWRAGGAAVFQQ